MLWGGLPKWRWAGPTVNQGGPMKEHRGVVLHIAEGYFDGTISWCRNPKSDTSAHFITGRDGRIAQLVDTETTAWTQQDGNGHWLSVENEGFTRGHDLHQPGWEKLTAAQVDANAAILVQAHLVYGIPLQVTSDPDGTGLGHHSMGAEHGERWGHRDCPGPPIIAQKQGIVDRAVALLVASMEVDMRPYLTIKHKSYPHTFALFPSGTVRWMGPAETKAMLAQNVPTVTTDNNDEVARLARLAGIAVWPPAK
jgi:hypothetical protein